MKRNIFIILAVLLISTLSFKGAFARLTTHTISNPTNSILVQPPVEEQEQTENAPLLLMTNLEINEDELSEGNETIDKEENQIIEEESRENEPIQQTEEIDVNNNENKEEVKTEEPEVQSEEVQIEENEETPVEEQTQELPEESQNIIDEVKPENSEETTKEYISADEE